jgi:hypothetical protein
VKAGALYAVITLVLTGLIGWLFTLGFKGPEARQAILVSGVIAFIVQMIAFAIAKQIGKEQIFLGWGIGSLLRLLTLAVYAMLVVKALGLPSSPALLSMATFFFVAIIVEPLLLNK